MIEESKTARASIISAFNRLILSRRQLRPRVADVLGEAGVARSTFYEHFNSRDSLLITAMRGPLSVIAEAATGRDDLERVCAILDHFKENRRSATEILTGPLGARITRALADLVRERADENGASLNVATHLAENQLSFIRLWLTGETVYATRDLARIMIRSAAALRAVLAEQAE